MNQGSENMNEYVTREEFQTLSGRVDVIAGQTNESKIWQGKYGERIDNIYKIVEDLSSKPQKRWDTLIASIITAAATAFVTLLFTGAI